MGVLDAQPKFQSLSLKDLLEARTQYHVHLMNRPNVVGTAVGLYLIRTTDPWPTRDDPDASARRTHVKEERRFDNSEVRPYSWPCVLVLVSKWVDEQSFGRVYRPEEIVPKTLYLADGRMVPVCVVKVESTTVETHPPISWAWPKSRMGGGFPLISRHQGATRVATAGCLVTDGHTTYALTNRHVSGGAGEPIYAARRGDEVEVGTASTRQLTRLPFKEVYADLPAQRAFLGLDVGLVELDDVDDWTSRIYGLPDVGPLADLNEYNIGVQLVDQPVAGFGAVSGLVEGRIKALFYRYKSVAGYDYMSDLLIAPAGETQTVPGDSGMVWHLKVVADKTSDANPPATTYRPIALEWGGQAFAAAGQTFNFALATNLSNVCRLLDVDLVSQHNTGAQPFWGARGHYSIAALAIDLVEDPKLNKLLQANAERISFDRSTLIGENVSALLDPAAFVPLADVPDVVWKKVASTVKGGRDPRPSKGPEHPGHYADIDELDANGATLRELSLADPANLTVGFWQNFYTTLGHTTSSSRGLLPFRVWQFYKELVGFVKAKKYDAFVAGAGILAHFVGDACQPLHGSVLADGYKDQAVDGFTSTGKPKKTWPAMGIHSVFETKMIDDKADLLFPKIEQQLAAAAPPLAPIRSGADAARATVELMAYAAQVLPPADLCDAYAALGGGKSKPVIDRLWKRFGTETADVMAQGARVLAHIWNCAWIDGGGDKAAAASLKTFTEAKLASFYRDPTFIPSLDLDQIGPVL
jgi:hypothetical protein